MISLPEVTLICLTNKDFEGHKKALDKSCEGIEFGAVKLIWDEKIKNIDDWNYKMIFELHNYVQTNYAMVIHADGYIVNPHLWRSVFLEYDYIGAPWPQPLDAYSYRDETGQLYRVGNSVSLRSRKILEAPTKLGLEWRKYFGNTNEDGFLCVHNRKKLEKYGCRFAPIEIACLFSKEHEIEENKDIKETFAFHQVDL